jgi:glycosyltransferase involved in cell wall biosynthesis
MTRPLTIAIPIHSFEPGGVERVALNLAQAWQQDGDEVHVILGRGEGAMAAGAPNLNYVTAPEPIPTARFETLWMMWRMWRYLRGNATDVVFCPGNTYAVVCAVMKLLLGRRCPPMAIKISNDLVRRDLPWPARIAYRGWVRLQRLVFDAVVAMAEPMREELASAFAIDPRSVVVIPDPALADGQYDRLMAIDRSNAPGTAHRFLAVGRLAAQKNLPMMLRAFAAHAPAASRLTIVGDGQARAALAALASKLGIENRVEFAGHCTDPAPWFAACDALLLSSDYEGVPAVVIEALAAGLPVVATDCSVSMRELLGNGRFGRLVPVGDEAAFGAALATVSPKAHPVEAARAAVSPFTLRSANPRYRALFLGLAKGRGTETYCAPV